MTGRNTLLFASSFDNLDFLAPGGSTSNNKKGRDRTLITNTVIADAAAKKARLKRLDVEQHDDLALLRAEGNSDKPSSNKKLKEEEHDDGVNSQQLLPPTRKA